MIIGVSGKSQSGKDTIAKIIQYLTTNIKHSYRFLDFIDATVNYEIDINLSSNWEIKKFADPVKDIVCIITGCTRDQLEDIDFKNSKLPDEWIRYGYADGFYRDREDNTVMNNVQCSKEKYEEELRVNWQTAYKHHATYREVLQFIGTDLFRNKLHEDTWVNALFNSYKPIDRRTIQDPDDSNINYPNWIITDVRFPNEAKAITDRGGIIIRVNRPIRHSEGLYGELTEDIIQKVNENHTDSISHSKFAHPSETALDDYRFEYEINNNHSINSLISQVEDILLHLKII